MPHEPGHIVDPDQFRDMLANLVVDDFLAQRDAANVANVNTGFEVGTPEDFLRDLFGVGIDFTPGLGDIKAAAFDAPTQFAGGQNIAGIISLLSAIPGIGILGDLIRASSRGAGGAAADVLRSTTGARADALAPLRRGTATDPAGEAARESLLDRILRGGREGPERVGDLAAQQVEDLASIRRQIFRDLTEPDPFGDVAARRGRVAGEAEELAARRSVRRPSDG